MSHPYIQQLLHKHQYREQLKQVEHDRLVQLVSHPASQLQTIVELSGLISKWWTNRWMVPTRNQGTKGKMVMPEA